MPVRLWMFDPSRCGVNPCFFSEPVLLAAEAADSSVSGAMMAIVIAIVSLVILGFLVIL